MTKDKIYIHKETGEIWLTIFSSFTYIWNGEYGVLDWDDSNFEYIGEL